MRYSHGTWIWPRVNDTTSMLHSIKVHYVYEPPLLAMAKALAHTILIYNTTRVEMMNNE